MKRVAKKSIFIAVCMFVGTYVNAIETVSLNEAIAKKMVKVSGVYNDQSVHYIRPVVLSIKSLISESIKIKIASGNIMEPEDSTFQNMMITVDTIIELRPLMAVNVKPFAMCTEHADRAGNKGLKYSFKSNKNSKLVEIARFINKYKIIDGTGQNAVWCVADAKKSLLEINGYDSLSRLRLIEKVAAITGKVMPSPIELKESYNSYILPVKKETIGGMFEFSYSKTTKVYVAMFNAQGTMVRELYYNPAEKPGVHKIDFEFDYTQYTDAYYTIKMIANNEVMLSSRIDRDDEGWEPVYDN